MTNDSQQREIAGRIRRIMAMENLSQADFARTIGIDPSNLSKSLTGRNPITSTLLNRIAVETGVSKQWLASGTGSMNPEPKPEGAPVYDIDITAGAVALSRMFTREEIIGFINLPEVPRDCPVVRVSGDSMSPVIQNGAMVAIRRVESASTIFWGQIYVVVLDDYRMVKYLRKSPDPSKVILHSANPDYDDIEVDRTEIRALFIVETVISLDRRY